MPIYITTYDVEIVYEGTGSYMNVQEEYEFFAENDKEASDISEEYMRSQIFDVVMPNISIVPSGPYIEPLDEDDADE